MEDLLNPVKWAVLKVHHLHTECENCVHPVQFILSKGHNNIIFERSYVWPWYLPGLNEEIP